MIEQVRRGLVLLCPVYVRIGRAVDDHVRLLFPHGASDRIGIGDVQLGHVGEDVPVRAARRRTTHLAPELPVGSGDQHRDSLAWFLHSFVYVRLCRSRAGRNGPEPSPRLFSFLCLPTPAVSRRRQRTYCSAEAGSRMPCLSVFLPAFWPVRPAIGRWPGSVVLTVRKKHRSSCRGRCIRRGPCISLPDYQSVPAPGMAAQRSDSLLRGVSRLPS